MSSVTWNPAIPNRRIKLQAKTGALRPNLPTVPTGEAVYRTDQQGFCYYIRGIFQGCYRTLKELMDAWDVELAEHEGGVTRSKIRKQKRRKTRRSRR